MLFSPNAEGSLVADCALEQFAELSDGQEGTQPLGSVIAMQGHCMRGSVSYLSGSVSPSFQFPPAACVNARQTIMHADFILPEFTSRRRFYQIDRNASRAKTLSARSADIFREQCFRS